MVVSALVRRVRDRLFGKSDDSRPGADTEPARARSSGERPSDGSMLDAWLELDSLTTEAKAAEDRFFDLLEAYEANPTTERAHEIERSLRRIQDLWADVEQQAARAATLDEDLDRARRSARAAKEAWADHLEAFDDGGDAFARRLNFDRDST